MGRGGLASFADRSAALEVASPLALRVDLRVRDRESDREGGVGVCV